MARARNATATAITVALAGLLTTACIQYIPSGATVDSGVVTIAYRPCTEDAVLGQLDVYDDAAYEAAAGDDATPVWSARLVDPAHGRRSLPIQAEVPGYAVDTRLPSDSQGLDPARQYIVDAVDDAGVSLDGPVFRPSELRPGTILERGRHHDAAEWTRRRDGCRTVHPAEAAAAGAAALALVAVVAIALKRRRRLHTN